MSLTSPTAAVPAVAPVGGHAAGSPDVTLDDLSKREVDVIRLITQGYSNEEICQELYVTNNTVKSFIRTAYRKIGVTRRSQAVIWGFKQGLLELPGTAA